VAWEAVRFREGEKVDEVGAPAGRGE
jgi:hypothetical protein